MKTIENGSEPTKTTEPFYIEGKCEKPSEIW